MANRYGNRGFADTARPDDADKADIHQMSRYAQYVLIASDHVHDAARQVAMPKIRRDRCRVLDFITRARHRRHEAIAAPGQRCDVPGAIFSIAEGLAQAHHVKAKAAFFDRDVGPDLRQELFLADDFVGPGDQSDQDVKGARAQFDGSAFSGEEPFPYEQIIGTKREAFSGLT